ncbi:MAG: leucine-rich repeat protein [Clostridia bacterium]|nr:leucine-rich repeat protein [Clostridia bacterium]
MKLSGKLIELRKAQGWSQEDFAEKLDVSRQAISRWENGTALPDAQNVLRISKLFNVTTDYLLNDDHEGEIYIPEVEVASEESAPVNRKKYTYINLIVAISFTVLLASVIVFAIMAGQTHIHPELTRAVENKVASTCTKEGSYDDVVYCAMCDEEVLRTKITTKKVEHQFKNKKCTACGEIIPSEGLLYMPNGNGTCFVSGGDCTDEHIMIPDYSPSGDKVTSIEQYAFRGNSKVKSVRIPETVTFIGEAAFRDCIKLESVNLPSKITVINPYTFSGCKRLKEIKIPAGVKKIGERAFENCISCTNIVIPVSVQEIGIRAFKNFSDCEGTITFERNVMWTLYDLYGNRYVGLGYANVSAATEDLTKRLCEFTWKR